MALEADLLNRKRTDFVPWHAKPTAAPPVLVIGEFQAGNPPSLKIADRIPLAQAAGFTDLFTIPAAHCGLIDDTIYHYFFRAGGRSTNYWPRRFHGGRAIAFEKLAASFTVDDRQPAAVIRFQVGRLVPCDPGGEAPDFSGDPSPATLSTDNHLVIYEMPTAWANVSGPPTRTSGTFRGEELSLPMALLTQGRLQGLWNDAFRALVRSVILGEGDNASFEANVRQMVDCRSLGFTYGSQAVNYITSHDVEGFRRERLYNFLLNVSLPGLGLEKRCKLAFVCLLTSVGIPMILAGDEFADEHSQFDQFGHVTQAGGKQVDPVNYGRLEGTDPTTQMRQRILAYVSRLVKLRASSPGLGVDDNNFFHIDFNDNKRVLAWTRGAAGMDPWLC